MDLILDEACKASTQGRIAGVLSNIVNKQWYVSLFGIQVGACKLFYLQRTVERTAQIHWGGNRSSNYSDFFKFFNFQGLYSMTFLNLADLWG